MLDRRLIILGAAAPIGLLVASVVWVASGGPNAAAMSIKDLEAELGSSPKGLVTQRAPTGVMAGSLATKPLFVLTTGPGALSEPRLRLIGVAVTPRGRTALISIDGALAEWVGVGQTKAGLTLTSVASAGVEVETALGPKTVLFGDPAPAGVAPNAGSKTAPSTTGNRAVGAQSPNTGVRPS